MSSGLSAHKKSKHITGDKRRYERIAIPIDVTYKFARHGKEQAACVDISGTGIRIATNKRFRVGEKIDLVIRIAKQIKPIIIKARVEWIRDEGGKIYAGLQFQKVTNRDEFIKFMCDKILYMLSQQISGYKKGGE